MDSVGHVTISLTAGEWSADVRKEDGMWVMRARRNGEQVLESTSKRLAFLLAVLAELLE